jgi:putative flavoprotein involved in K+ transport
MDGFRKLAVERGLPWPAIPVPEPIEATTPERVSLAGLGAVVFAGGFSAQLRVMGAVPGAFDELGFPIHDEGASSVVPGLYFVGVHFPAKAQVIAADRRGRGRRHRGRADRS